MMRRICTLAAVVLAMLAFAPAASAQTYGGGTIGGNGTTISGHICEGENGPQADVPVQIFVDGVLIATVFTDSNGDFTATLPADLSDGTHTVTAVAFGGDCVLSTTITKGGATTTLPRTGSNDTLPLTKVGIATIAAGGALLLVSRKRLTKKVDAPV